MGQTRSGSLGFDTHEGAQAFTTGDNSDGYTVSAPRRPPRFPALAQFASAARRVPRAPIPVAFALAVLAVLATVAPEPAAAQTVTTFISNTGQTSTTASSLVQATEFTTGTGTYTLTLSSVGIFIPFSVLVGTPAVKIYGDTGGTPGTLLATMTNPGTFADNAVHTFTAPANTTLSASTTYWLVTSNSAATDGTGFRVGVVGNTTLDSGAAAGWSIGAARLKSDIADASWTPSSRRIRFAIRGTNPPTVATAIPDQSATAGTAFSYVFPANTFSDADTGDTLSYTATKTDGTALPTWLAFAASTRTFSGTPQAADAGTVSVKVIASDGNGGSVSDTFDITVAADTTPPTLTSADVEITDALIINLVFSEDLQLSNPPAVSAFTVTVDGSAATVSSVLVPGSVLPQNELWLQLSTAIRQRQAVVVTYTDATSGDDTAAIQDTAGNDAATFTTGMDGVPAVTNNSTVTNTVPADWSLIPTGLSTGDKFRLLFLSSTKRNASSTDIADYNTFIQTRAAAGHTDIQDYSADFRAVGCTADTDARDNTKTTYTTTDKGVPIYWLNGAKAADQYEDFYDGSWDDEANDKNESGTNGLDTSQNVNYPWTGCDHDGTEAVTGGDSFALGTGLADARVGRPNSSVSNVGPLNGQTNRSDFRNSPMYGLSAVFQVAAAVVVPNNPPAFSGTTAARSVAENTAAGQNVGAALTATDADSDTLTYTLEGTDAASFDIVSGSGQIRTRTGVTYNHEAKSTHTVVVKADDGNGGTDTIAVTITVTDVDEPPGQPAAPSVSATAGSTTSLDVTWTAPTNTGPAIASYDLQYRAGTSGNFTNGPQNVTGTSAAIGTLAADTSYEVQVRATNAEGDGDWSVAGTGRTTATSAPGAPTGLSATASGTTAINLSWSAPASTGGSAITGYKIEVSPNGTSGWTDLVANTNSTATTVTWAASGEDRDAFAIGSTGVLSFVSPPDFENPSDADGDNVYTVGIVAADGSATGLAFATVVVANVELPEFPSATTTRSVAENTGPGVSIGAPVTATTVGAAVTYTLAGTDAASFDIDAATGQLQAKAALDYETRSSYEVTVTATNSEGSVDIMVTIDVTNIIELQPITGPATVDYEENRAVRVAAYSASSEADRELLTWSLSGADAGSFRIDEPGGVLRFDLPVVFPNLFSPQPDYEAPTDTGNDGTYEVTVEVSDGTDTVTLKVTVTITNLDEAGAFSLFPTNPLIGTVVQARLSDPDEPVNEPVNEPVWEWARSSDKSSWTAITDFGTLKDTSGNVTTAPPGPNYAPGDADTGMYFRVRVAYTDGTGSRKTLQVISNQVVRERAPAPDITIVELVSDLTIPWDLAFTPDGTMLFTERPGKLSARLASGTIQTVTADFSDLQLLGSNGLLAIVVDHDFATNRRFYTCQSHTGRKVQIIAWTISSDYTAATRVADPLVGDIPSGWGGHPGCRLRIGPEGYLWIATGDGYSPSAPQDLGSLAGKILRVDVTAGDGAPGNPFSSRVYSYGHRDPQGLALRPGTTEMWSMEHGPNWDDEINLLVAGANYGWDPADGPGYNHKAPMTDLRKFPDALEAKWSSEKETLAISGGIFLDDSAWGAWNGRLAVAALKAQSLNLFEFDSSGTLLSHVVVPELHEHYGRLRTPMTGPDGALYVTTSNGTSLDYILKVVPSLPPQFSAEVTTQSVEENRGASTVVATVTAIDPEGGAVTYTLGGGEDARNFNIANPDIGEVRADAPLDYETKSSYTVDVIATDPWGLDDAITLTINVENIDELPEFPSATMTRSVAENTGPGVSIGAPVTATTVGAAVTYTLGGTDAASFDIVEATGQLQTKAALDYETRPSYEVTVTATNLEGSVDIMVTIDVTNVIELQPLAVTTCSGGMAGTYPCRNVDLMSFLALADIGGGSANDVWGWTDSSTGKEYAIMGRTNGTSFVDISDPVNPIYLGNLPPHSDDSTGRDIKVYADHAFIVTEANNSGMQVFDLTQLRMVASPPATFSETAHYPDFSDAHNLAINEESGFAYAVGTNTCSGGLHMINIQTPTNPTSAACFSGDGYTHDAQCVIYDGPDLDHKRKEICFNSNEDTLTIVDVTNKAGPVMLSRTGYSGSRYAHQGWLTEDQVYFLLGDELDEANNPDVTNTRTYMWDVSDLDDPALIGSHDSTTTAIDHNQYVKGNYTYQSNYQAGLRILDITDIANGNLSEAAFFDVNPGSDPTNTDGGTWSNYPFFDSGIVIVSVIEQGLFILRPNLVDGVNPALSSASVNGAALTLTYGEALDEGSRPAPGDFTVQVDGSGRSVSGVSVSGRVVTLTLASVVAHDETVTVSYSPGANPIRDAAGNGAIGLSNEPVANETPETALPNMWLNPTKSDPVASVRSEATYTVTFQGAWNTTVTAGGVPSGGHFTTLIGGVHNAEVTFLKEGGMATAGVEIMAELGGTGTLTNEVRAAEPNALSVLQGSAGNIGPTGSSTINMVTLTTDHPRVTLLSMVAPSPDWFVGVSGLSLLDAGAGWLPSQTVNLYPWDAGTEEGTEFSLTNSATSPQETITSLRGIGKFSNERIATLTFTRQSVNTAPSFTSDTGFEADENQTAAGRVAATDPDRGDVVTYAITGGADASKFDIGETTGVLTFQVPPNYERAADVASTDPVNGAGNNEYIVTVTATGGTGDRAMTTEQTITVTVRNVEEAGTISFSQAGLESGRR